MSFVGIVAHRGYLYGFGDSKASLTNVLGVWPDNNRPFVRKVFKTDSILVVRCGNNVFYPGGGTETDVSEWVLDNIGRFHGPTQFIAEFYGMIDSSPGANQGVYEFIFGTYADGLPCMRRCAVDNGKLIIEPAETIRDRSTSIRTCGNKFYSNDDETKALSRRLDDVAIGDVPGYIEKYVHDRVLEGDTFGCYNPVGGDIVVEKMFPPGHGTFPEGMI